MHYALNVVDQVMNLALQDRFKIFLEFPAGNLHIYAQWKSAALFEICNIRADDFDFAVVNITHLRLFTKLGGL